MRAKLTSTSPDWGNAKLRGDLNKRWSSWPKYILPIIYIFCLAYKEEQQPGGENTYKEKTKKIKEKNQSKKLFWELVTDACNESWTVNIFHSILAKTLE